MIPALAEIDVSIPGLFVGTATSVYELSVVFAFNKTKPSTTVKLCWKFNIRQTILCFPTPKISVTKMLAFKP